MADSPDFTVFKSVFSYCILILVLPVSAFFFSKAVLDVLIGSAGTTSSVCSAIVAVVILHIALGLFIFRAYADPDRSRIERKDDKID